MHCCGQIVDFDCGFEHVVAIASNGDTYAWGNNDHFQCGMGMTHPLRSKRVMLPFRVPALIGRVVTAVACGAAHTLVITASKEVFAWGAGADGQLGLGTTSATSACTTFVARRSPLVSDVP